MDHGMVEGSESMRLVPVPGGSAGEGLPYAPQDWPRAGDKWTWKVGKRSAHSGHWLDRYLCLPKRLQSVFGRRTFASKQAVAAFVKKEFPDTDVESFFASFSWVVPCSGGPLHIENNNCPTLEDGRQLVELDNETEVCVAGNKMCFLRQQTSSSSLEDMDCDICCSEPGFCRNCCCILCCGAIDWEYGGYSFVRCEAKVGKNSICGHVAHLECALHCCMAGTVGGAIELDVEYYCRRCDNRMGLLGHAKNLLQTCESVNSGEIITKMLTLAICILRGSEQAAAKGLMTYIEFALEKLRRGVNPRELWKRGDQLPTTPDGDTSDLHNIPLAEHFVGVGSNLASAEGCDGEDLKGVYLTSDYHIESMKLENEIDQVLSSLRKSQESEFTLAEQKLYSHKNILLSLYRQLELERSELSKCASFPNKQKSDSLLANVLRKVDQINEEVIKLKQMMEVSKGFSRTSKKILVEHFSLNVDD